MADANADTNAAEEKAEKLEIARQRRAAADKQAAGGDGGGMHTDSELGELKANARGQSVRKAAGPSDSDLFTGARDQVTGTGDVAAQSQAALTGAGMTGAVAMGDLEKIKELLKEDPKKLYTRDAVGATPVHFAAVVGKFELCKTLIGELDELEDPKRGLCQSYYAGGKGPYEGENLLHIAIVKKNYEFAEWLLNQPSGPKLLNGRATGSFFSFGNGIRPDNELGKKGTQGACYYGEYPILFAVATNQPEMVELCLEYSDLKDGELFRTDKQKKNGALHIAALHNLPRMLDYLCDIAVDRKMLLRDENVHPDEDVRASRRKLHECLDEGARKDTTVKGTLFREWYTRLNSDACSALTMAAQRGESKMVMHLLERNKIVEWGYGPVTSVLYPLEGVDVPHDFHWGTAICPGKKKADKKLAETDLRLQAQMKKGSDDVYDMLPGDSVICHLARGNKLELFDHHLIKAVIRNKWNNFGLPRFRRLIGSVLAFMTLFTVAEVGLAKYKWWQNPDLFDSDPDGCYARIAIEGTAVLVYVVFKLKLEIVEAWQAKGFFGYITQAMGVAVIDNYLTIALVLCMIGVAVTRVGGSQAASDQKAGWYEAESSITSVLSLVGWSYATVFLMGIEFTGAFIVMLIEMFRKDVSRFLAIFACILIAFSESFYVAMDLAADRGGDGALGGCSDPEYETVGACEEAGAEWEAERYIFWARVKHLMQLSFDGPEWDGYQSTTVVELLFFLFTILVMVMLLNMLIAQMGDTYTKIYDDAHLTFLKNRAGLIYQFERSVTANKLRSSIPNLVIMHGAAYIRVENVDDGYYGRDEPFAVPLRRLEDLLGKSKGNADMAKTFAETKRKQAAESPAEAKLKEAASQSRAPVNEEKATVYKNVKETVTSCANTRDLAKLFAVIDVDGDNKVDSNEFTKFIEGCMNVGKKELSADDIKETFEYISYMDPAGKRVVTLDAFEDFFFTRH